MHVHIIEAKINLRRMIMRGLGQELRGEHPFEAASRARRFTQRYAPNTSYTGGFGAQRTKASAYCRPHSIPRQRLQAV